jgi:Flp pilus assembly protein TadD
MQFLKASVILAAFALFFDSGLLDAAAERAITGRLIFENGFTCEQQCVVTLLSLGVRPVQTVLADLSGRFTFDRVPAGSYTIRVEIDGFEIVNQQVNDFDAGFGINIMVPAIRRSTVPSNGDHVVDVSEFIERYPKKAVSLFEKGSQSLKKKNNDEAVKYFESALELAPAFYQAHNQLGIAYRESGRFDDAEREFVKAHELNSTGVEPLVNLTMLYLDQNEPERAVRTGEQAVQANSRSASAFFGLGVALYKTVQLDRAEATLKRALDLDPRMGETRLALANVYLKLRRYDNTLEQLNSYIAENPNGRQLQDAREMRDRLIEARAVERP